MPYFIENIESINIHKKLKKVKCISTHNPVTVYFIQDDTAYV